MFPHSPADTVGVEKEGENFSTTCKTMKMYAPTIDEKKLLNFIYSIAGTIDLIICPFTIFMLLLPVPSYLKVFRRIQFAIVINAFLLASTFFILRPVLTTPLAIYSISGWNLSQEAIFSLFVGMIISGGFSGIFLLVAYFHRAVVLAPFPQKRPLTIYYTILTVSFCLAGLLAIGYFIWDFFALSRYLDNSEFQAIKSFSAVTFFSGGSFRIIVYGTIAPVSWLFCTFMGTIYLIHRFSLNSDKKSSKKTQQRQNQLYRLTLIQAAILGTTVLGPAVIIFFGMAEWLPVADIFLFYAFIPLTFHSPGNCVALLCTSHYRKVVYRWLTDGKKPLNRVKTFCRNDGRNPSIIVEAASSSRRISSKSDIGNR